MSFACTCRFASLRSLRSAARGNISGRLLPIQSQPFSQNQSLLFTFGNFRQSGKDPEQELQGASLLICLKHILSKTWSLLRPFKSPYMTIKHPRKAVTVDRLDAGLADSSGCHAGAAYCLPARRLQKDIKLVFVFWPVVHRTFSR